MNNMEKTMTIDNQKKTKPSTMNQLTSELRLQVGSGLLGQEELLGMLVQLCLLQKRKKKEKKGQCQNQLLLIFLVFVLFSISPFPTFTHLVEQQGADEARAVSDVVALVVFCQVQHVRSDQLRLA